MIVEIKKRIAGQKAQALLEFALAIPIILVLVIGMFEVGRLITYYSAVNSAAREAARYGAASGTVGTTPRYCDAGGIRASAVKPGFIAGVQGTTSDVLITYDTGPGTATYDPCAAGAKLKDATRINVEVIVTYTPSVSFPSSNVGRTVRAKAARTIMSEIYVPDAAPASQSGDPSKIFPPTNSPTVASGGGGNCPGNKTCTPTPTAGPPTSTATPGPSPTATVTQTPTKTPLVILPTPIVVIPTCTLGHSDLLFTTGTTPTWSLINYYNTAVTITKVEIFSNISGQAVTSITLGGTGIFSGSAATPTLIKSGWAGTTLNRQLGIGESKIMNLTLSKADMVGSLQIKVTFDIGGCNVLDSNLVQP